MGGDDHASEKGAVACDDGVDNDSDGRTDYNVSSSLRDPGCTGPTDTSEKGTAVCDDGIDNDSDGRTDYRTDSAGDPGCSGLSDSNEHNFNIDCDDGSDNDGDGCTDYPRDPSCSSLTENSEWGYKLILQPRSLGRARQARPSLLGAGTSE